MSGKRVKQIVFTSKKKLANSINDYCCGKNMLELINIEVPLSIFLNNLID